MIGPEIRMQLSAFCVLMVVLVDFVNKKRIKQLSTKFFHVILGVVFAYLIFDIATVYTLTNQTSSATNELVHRMFYILLLTSILSFALYVEIVGNRRTEMTKQKWVQLGLFFVPYLICVLGFLFCKIEYVIDEKGVYSHGSAVGFLYVGIMIYLVLMLVETFRYKETIGRSYIIAIRLQLLMWAMAFIIQVSNPYMLLSGLVMALSVLILYFSAENPMINTDEVTQAYNLRGFNKAFYEECHCFGKKPFYLMALVIEDIDVVIASIGRDNYEQILSQMVQDFSMMSRQDVYRLKDSILTILLPMKGESVEKIGTRMEQRMSKPFFVTGTGVTLKAHMLAAECPKFLDDPEEVIETIRSVRAQDAVFLNRIGEEDIQKKHRKDTLLRMIKDAVEHDGFEVVYQPIYSTKKKGFYTSEALVRLKDTETLGFVSPEEFIPLAEQNGYIVKIGEIVFSKVCDTICEMKESNIPLSYIEVNLSALQIIDEKVQQSFEKIMKKKGLDPAMINLEITETTAVGTKNLMEKNMKAFKSMGCTFSMDDFGTGYSNLASMVNSSFELVKIDKSLIWPCFENKRTGQEPSEEAKTVLESVVRMLISLGFHIVAEGVETQEMADMLTNLGVHYLQGYCYSKPIDKTGYLAYIMTYKEKEQNNG